MARECVWGVRDSSEAHKHTLTDRHTHTERELAKYFFQESDRKRVGGRVCGEQESQVTHTHTLTDTRRTRERERES